MTATAASGAAGEMPHLQHLDELYFSDNPARIEGPALAIAYCNVNDLNFADEKLYTLPSNAFPYFSKEIGHMAKLRDNLELGQKMLALLYSYRTVSRGIPQAHNQEQANRPELYQTAYAVLAPEIGKMKTLLKYCDESTTLLASVFTALVPEHKESCPSAELLLVLAQTLDMMLVLDSLKNGKASLNNDFSMYKRIISNLKNLVRDVDDETMENHMLYNFLGTQNVYAMKLKEKLGKVNEYEDLMVDIVTACATAIETRQYVTPDAKHSLLKAMTFGLYLLESGADTREVYKRKNFRLDRCGKIIKSMPVVPLFGDMSMTLASLFVKIPRLKEQKWEHDPADETLQRSYKIVYHMDSIRQRYHDYLLQFKLITNMAKIKSSKSVPADSNQAETVYNLLLSGVNLISECTSRVLEQSAWKFANPTSSYVNKDCPADASLYEMAVRYNYDSSEQVALVEMIGMIKTLAQTLLNAETSMMKLVLQYISSYIQAFVRTTLRELLLHVSKKKKPILQVISHIYNIMAEKFDANYLEEEKSKKGKDVTGQPMSARSVSVALTQLHYIRVLLDSATNERAKGMQGGFMKDKDFKDEHVVKVAEFLSHSFNFPAMINFVETVRNCGDLSELWYKEFYLELTKQIQFPIEMSLPWILTDAVLKSEAPDLVEWILYPLDIYNDAGNRALHQLRAQFLYDEIEAEVNLCFDQFIWKLSQKVFADYKTRVASHMLDKVYKQELEYMLNIAENKFDLTNLRYATILKQKRFQLLGRSVCISRHVAQFCNQHMRQSIDIAISRYEASDLTHIVDLEDLLLNTTLVHMHLSKHLVLDPFEDILAEADEATSLVQYNGRIVGHTVQELLTDIIPNYCYNSTTKRFIRTTLVINQESNRAPVPKMLSMYLYGAKLLDQAYGARFNLFHGFLGAPHFAAMMRVVGIKHCDILLCELSKSVELMLKFNVTPYIKAMAKGMPHATKLPPFEYGVRGCFEYFQLILKPILIYRDLKSGIFQVFRELGNVIIFFQLLEGAMKANEISRTIQSAAFVGVVSRLTDSKPDARLMIKTVMDGAQRVLAMPNATVSYSQQGERAEMMSECFTDPCLMSLFLKKLIVYVMPLRPQWESPLPSKDDLQVDHSAEFYRVWSAIRFAFCIPPASSTEYSNRELYGEGPIWAGCTLIHILDESKRFQAFDFSRFLSNVAATDIKSLTAGAAPGAVDISKVVEMIDFYCSIDNEVSTFLKYRCPVSE